MGTSTEGDDNMSNMPRTTADTGAQTKEMTPRNIGPTVASKINNGRDPEKERVTTRRKKAQNPNAQETG